MSPCEVIVQTVGGYLIAVGLFVAFADAAATWGRGL